MKNISIISLAVWFLFMIPNHAFGQDEIIIEKYPEWFLEMALNAKQCIHGKKMDVSIFWEDNTTHDFLIKMLAQGNTWQKGKAMVYLGMSKKDAYFKIISPFLDDEEYNVLSSSAISALVSIGNTESTDALGRNLTKQKETNYNQIVSLIEGLEQITNPKGKKYLTKFIEQSQNTYFIKKAEESIQLIERFNKNTEERKKLILEKLYSTNSNDTNWALSKIRATQNPEYLVELRKLSLKTDEYKRSILTIRESLGDELFSEEELKFMENIRQQKKILREYNQQILSEGKEKHWHHIDDF